MSAIAGQFTLLVVLSIVPFLPSITGGEILDDFRVIHDAAIERLIARRFAGWWRFPRLVTRLSHHWTRGGGPLADHAFNIAVHVLNVLLVFVALRAAGAGFALVVAAGFAVHPVQVFSAGYVSARAGLLSFFWSALLVNVWLLPLGGLWSKSLCTLLLVLLGWMSKEDSVIYLLAIACGALWLAWG